MAFDPSLPTSQIQATADAIFAQQANSEFGTQRFALHDILTVSLGGVGTIDYVVNDFDAPVPQPKNAPSNVVLFPPS